MTAESPQVPSVDSVRHAAGTVLTRFRSGKTRAFSIGDGVPEAVLLTYDEFEDLGGEYKFTRHPTVFGPEVIEAQLPEMMAAIRSGHFDPVAWGEGDEPEAVLMSTHQYRDLRGDDHPPPGVPDDPTVRHYDTQPLPDSRPMTIDEIVAMMGPEAVQDLDEIRRDAGESPSQGLRRATRSLWPRSSRRICNVLRRSLATTQAGRSTFLRKQLVREMTDLAWATPTDTTHWGTNPARVTCEIVWRRACSRIRRRSPTIDSCSARWARQHLGASPGGNCSPSSLARGRATSTSTPVPDWPVTRTRCSRARSLRPVVRHRRAATRPNVRLSWTPSAPSPTPGPGQQPLATSRPLDIAHFGQRGAAAQHPAHPRTAARKARTIPRNRA